MFFLQNDRRSFAAIKARGKNKVLCMLMFRFLYMGRRGKRFRIVLKYELSKYFCSKLHHDCSFCYCRTSSTGIPTAHTSLPVCSNAAYSRGPGLNLGRRSAIFLTEASLCFPTSFQANTRDSALK
jgi:hypothetical protein